MWKTSRKTSLDAHGHYNTEVSLFLEASDHSRAQSVLELEHYLVGLEGGQGVQEVSRVEADCNFFPGVHRLQALLGLSELRVVGGDLEAAWTEGHLHRFGPVFRHDGYPSQRRHQRGPGQ